MENQLSAFFSDVKEIGRLYRQGLSINQISKGKKIPKKQVSFILRQLGFDVTAPKRTDNSPSEEEVQKFISLYKAGENASAIGRSMGYAHNTVLRYLKDRGIHKPKPKATNQQIQKMNDLYHEGLTSYEVAEKMGVSKTTVLYHVVNTRGYGPVPAKVNSDYFSKIDDQDKAFWLGVMFADGNVNNEDNSVTLTSTDKGMVRALRQALSSEHNIHTKQRSKDNPKWKDAYTLRIFDKKLKDDLVKHGCIANKTYSVKVPDLQPELYRHFIRGVFDGDGSVWGKPGKGYFSITGYLPFLDKLQDILAEQAGVSKTKLAVRKPDFGDIRYGGKAPMRQLYDYLYKDARYFLRRKKEKFATFLD